MLEPATKSDIAKTEASLEAAIRRMGNRIVVRTGAFMVMVVVVGIALSRHLPS